jgi:hypothetical protein
LHFFLELTRKIPDQFSRGCLIIAGRFSSLFDTNDRDELRAALDTFQVAMCAVEVGPDGNLVYVGHNDLLMSMLGLSVSSITDKPFETVFASKDVPRISANYQHCMDTRAPVQSKVDVELPGGPVMLTSTIVPVFDATGQIKRVIGNTVGMKFYKKVQYDRLLDKLTRLSTSGASTLFDALRAIEVRRETEDLSPDEERFLAVFDQLSSQALQCSLEIRDLLRDEGKALMGRDQFLSDSALSKAIEELAGLELTN